jgi:CO/xanthine dehydrogenase FAD-binding subunit
VKPAPFDYIRARSLDEALDALAAGAGDALVLAGGQTLVPMMAMRLARPATLVDINEIATLTGIEETAQGLRIRAMTRQAAALESETVRRRAPLLAKALSFVGHQQTRNRGTVGGSCAHADPSAEIPLTAITLDAEITLTKKSSTRAVMARDLFEGALATTREPDEVLTEIAFPTWSGRIGVGFQEVSPRHGDFAIVAAAVQLELDTDGVCKRAAIGVGGASPSAVRVHEAEAALVGKRIDAALAAAVARATDGVIAPGDDLHATAAYRRRAARVLVERAILEAVA